MRVGYFLEVLRRELPDSLPNAARPRVLDLGCGGGIVAEALAAGGCTVVGLDPSLPSLAPQGGTRTVGRRRRPPTSAGPASDYRSPRGRSTRSSARTRSSTSRTSTRRCARSAVCYVRAGCCCSTRRREAGGRGSLCSGGRAAAPRTAARARLRAAAHARGSRRALRAGGPRTTRGAGRGARALAARGRVELPAAARTRRVPPRRGHALRVPRLRRPRRRLEG